MKLHHLIERHWYVKPNLLLAAILLPASLIFKAIVGLRKWLFTLGIKQSTALGVPVVIVGNLSVGGAGKTPLTKMLATTLSANGIKLGIILRGYKANNRQPRLVSANDDSREVGDEALIYAQAGFMVAIGAERVAAGQLLLDNYPQTQLIIADDGLQHYALRRDFEICVIDGSRLFGNRHLLPMGPLREPVSRLQSVDAVVITQSSSSHPLNHQLYSRPIYWQQLKFIAFYNPYSKSCQNLEFFKDKPLLALAAIGNPQRYFNYLDQLGVNISKWCTFPDHYHYQASDIEDGYAIITTEKDYTKLAAFDQGQIWITQVEAQLDNQQLLTDLYQLITKGKN